MNNCSLSGWSFCGMLLSTSIGEFVGHRPEADSGRQKDEVRRAFSLCQTHLCWDAGWTLPSHVSFLCSGFVFDGFTTTQRSENTALSQSSARSLRWQHFQDQRTQTLSVSEERGWGGGVGAAESEVRFARSRPDCGCSVWVWSSEPCP